jgi:hypothetical protein
LGKDSLNQLRFTVHDTQNDAEPESAGLAALLIDHQVRTAEFLILLAPWPEVPAAAAGTRSRPLLIASTVAMLRKTTCAGSFRRSGA